MPVEAGFAPGTFRSRGGRLTTKLTRRSEREREREKEKCTRHEHTPASCIHQSMLSRAKKINVHSPTSCTQHSILNFCVIFFTKITMHRHPPRVLTNTFQVSNLNLILLSKAQINSGSPNVHQTSISKRSMLFARYAG